MTQDYDPSPSAPALRPRLFAIAAMAILGWVWRRRFADQAFQEKTPCRLVYCLPMRGLVEQTRDEAIRWLHALGLLAGNVDVDDAGKPLPDTYRAPSVSLKPDDRIAVIGSEPQLYVYARRRAASHALNAQLARARRWRWLRRMRPRPY